MTMQAEEALDRVLRALKTELRATHNIGAVERRVGRSRGYFSKVSARKWRISLDVLLTTLEALEIDPGTFFANAFAPPRKTSDLAVTKRYTSTAPRLQVASVSDLPRRQPAAGTGRRW